MKVYVLVSGEYDVQVENVFISKELAQRSILLTPDLDHPRILEMDLIEKVDIPQQYEVGPRYTVRLSLEENKLQRYIFIYVEKCLRHPQNCQFQLVEPADIPNWREPNPIHRDGYVMVYSPISYEDAEKFAIRKREEWLKQQKKAPEKL